jgi:DNA-binding XRE family transcriptional regulator
MEVLRLKDYREKLKMSQRNVADLLEMTQQGYHKWESGVSLPNAKQIVRLCEIFKCTPNDLFGFRGVHEVVGQMIDDAK